VTPAGLLSLAPDAAHTARRSLDDAGFKSDAILAALNLKDTRHIDRLPNATALESLDDDGIGPLIRLFVIEGTLRAELAESALPQGVGFWEDLGLVRSLGGKVEATVRLHPDDEFLLASDWPASREHDIEVDHVLGHNPTAALLDNITIRSPDTCVLDLGTGCGIQALVASTHARRVVATDLNPRAVNIASFNALLNGADIDCRQGNLFEPVAGQTFDLIVSNPPFVISPDSAYTFRDSELGGEGITRQIISSAAEFLNEDGFCQLLSNWAHHGNEDWLPPVRAAFDGCGCDVWVLKVNEVDAPMYATGWLRAQEHSPQRFQEELGRWLAYYERENIVSVSWAFVTMRKRSSLDNWFAFSEMDLPLEDRCGDHVRRCFEGYGVLALHSPREVLQLTPRVSPAARLEQAFAPERGGWSPDSSRLVTAGGLPLTGGVDAHVANMLIRCDGQTQLEEVFRRSAEDAEVPYEAMLPECLKITKRLFEGGHLIVE
jgi:hypothetical protein